MDFAPTFLDLAGISLPAASQQIQRLAYNNADGPRSMTRFRGKDVHAFRGKSWMPFYCEGKQVEENEMWAVHSSSEPIGWELFARGALRKGDWKIVHIPKRYGGAGVGDDGWELFNVVADPGETINLATQEPDKMRELLVHWDDYVLECGVVWGKGAQTPGLDIDEAPELWEDELELQQLWMGAGPGQCPASCQ